MRFNFYLQHPKATHVLALSLLLCGLGMMAVPAQAKSDEPMLMPMMEVEPQLDTEDPALKPEAYRAPVSATQPLKAKAVVVDLKSDTFTYDKSIEAYIATGSVHVVISEQNSELFADKVTYDPNQELLIAEGKVTILKHGKETKGSFAKIDLSRESALINDIATSVEKIRVEAKQSLVSNNTLIFEHGKLILSGDTFGKMMTSSRSKGPRKSLPSASKPIAQDDDFTLDNFAQTNGLVTYKEGLIDENSQEKEVLTNREHVADVNDKFDIHTKEMNIYRWADGYTKVDMKWPTIKVGNLKVPLIYEAQFSQDPESGEVEWLGPDIGYDPDYGGAYFGPGWDFRVGEKGSVRFSPLVSMGGGGRRMRGGSRFEKSTFGPGIGGVVHYRAPGTMMDLSYNSHVGQPVGYAEKKLFDGKTKVSMSVNEDYSAGFLGWERPGYSAMISDTRKIADFGPFQLNSYESAGFFKDDFFPLNTNKQFVQPDDNQIDPSSAGRIQLQAQLRNTKPLLSMGVPGAATLDFGLTASANASAYTSGDFYGLVRGGPSMNVRLGNRFTSSMQYYLSGTAGDTPFVFDTYFRGRQSIWMNNSIKVTNFLTVGTRTNMSLQKDNAQNSMFTGNALYMLVGPDSVKFNIAYDVIRKRSYFGINFFPGKNDRPINFDRMRMFEPDEYNPMTATQQP